MSDLARWLESYEPYLDKERLLALFDRSARRDPPPDDPEALFREVMAPLEFQELATKAFTTVFTKSAPAEEVQTTPRAALDFGLAVVRNAEGRMPPGELEAVARACLKLDLLRESEICTAVAYLSGGRTPGILGLLTGLALREGRLAAARELSQEARSRHPDAPEPLFYSALVALASGDRKGAADRLQELVRNRPEYAPGWSLLVDLYAGERRWDKAARMAEEATRRFPRDPESWEKLALILHHGGQARRAAAAMERALAVAAESVGIDRHELLRMHLAAAALEEGAGRGAKALEIYQELLEEGHRAPALFLNAASCLKALGRPGAAEELLARGLEIHPQHPDLLTNLGELCFESGEDERAFALLQAAAEREPRRTGNLILMAALLLRAGDLDGALELAEAVARADPSRRPEAMVLIGDVHRFRGAPEAAGEAYREAARLAPHNREIALRRKRFAAAETATS
ncbi:MAG: hypothetical protein Kow0092_05020 [Deferrisomatales bacterium]